jgi:hypothetical protein
MPYFNSFLLPQLFSSSPFVCHRPFPPVIRTRGGEFWVGALGCTEDAPSIPNSVTSSASCKIKLRQGIKNQDFDVLIYIVAGLLELVLLRLYGRGCSDMVRDGCFAVPG